jgi:hypothetical protein
VTVGNGRVAPDRYPRDPRSIVRLLLLLLLLLLHLPLLQLPLLHLLQLLRQPPRLLILLLGQLLKMLKRVSEGRCETCL